MQQVLRYFHQDPKKSVQSTSTSIINQMSQSISSNTRAIDDKQDQIPGKSLSSNDFTDYYKNKLRGIEEEAEVNVQADWDENDSTADSYIKNKPELKIENNTITLGDYSINIDNSVTEDSNNLITSGAVFKAIDDLPEPMIFKGSLGVDGTITVLPQANNANIGFTYKVITAGTYENQYAKPGDTFISDGTQWVYIPSGDEPEGTVTSITIKATSPVQTNNSEAITTSGTRTISLIDAYGDTKNPYGVKSKNTVLAGPTTGIDAVPIFRALVQDDIPNLSWSKINATVNTTTVGSASTGTNISADDITLWNAGTTPTLGTNISADDITSWSAGTLPTLGTAISADDITSWSAGSTPTLGNEISASNITAWSAGSTPTLGTAISADDITKWTTNVPTKVTSKTVVTGGSTTDVPNISSKTVVVSASVKNAVLTISTGASVTTGTAIKAYTSLTTGDSCTVTAGTAATLEYTSRSIPNVTNVGTAPSLTYSSVSIPNVTGVGTLPSLSYTEKSIPNVTSVGTLPSLSYTSRSIPNVTGVGTLPSLSYTSRSIPNVTDVGTLPQLEYTAKSIPNISVTNKTVVTGITTS